MGVYMMVQTWRRHDPKWCMSCPVMYKLNNAFPTLLIKNISFILSTGRAGGSHMAADRLEECLNRCQVHGKKSLNIGKNCGSYLPHFSRDSIRSNASTAFYSAYCVHNNGGRLWYFPSLDCKWRLEYHVCQTFLCREKHSEKSASRRILRSLQYDSDPFVLMTRPLIQ